MSMIAMMLLVQRWPNVDDAPLKMSVSIAEEMDVTLCQWPNVDDAPLNHTLQIIPKFVKMFVVVVIVILIVIVISPTPPLIVCNYCDSFVEAAVVPVVTAVCLCIERCQILSLLLLQ